MPSVVEKVTDACKRNCESLPFVGCRGYVPGVSGTFSIKEDLPLNYELSKFIKELKEYAFSVSSCEEETLKSCVIFIYNKELFQDELFKCTLTLSNGNVVEIVIEVW